MTRGATGTPPALRLVPRLLALLVRLLLVARHCRANVRRRPRRFIVVYEYVLTHVRVNGLVLPKQQQCESAGVYEKSKCSQEEEEGELCVTTQQHSTRGKME